ncbi:AAA family ATPase [Candidatus Campbellbacteria bacterium]|nr:MAG: AAA family ATPase [Candidatus Campbellbacteria bacterium]
MPITKVKEIKNIDAFDSFQWSAGNLKKYNLIYGWNGCGKTTISRVLSFIEKKKIDMPEFFPIQFQVQTGTGSTKESDLPTNNLSIKVFNEDFIRENLEFHESKAKKILIVGKDNINAQAEIATLEARVTTAREVYSRLEADKGKISSIDNILTEAAREVIKQFTNTPLGSGTYYGRSYNRTKIEPLVTEGKITQENIDSLIIEKLEDVDSKREIIKSQKQKIGSELKGVEDFSSLFECANVILDKFVDVEVIPGLDSDKELRDWTEHGYHIHKDRSLGLCQFCKKSLDKGFLENLGKFFTEELEKAKQGIDDIVSKIDLPENKADTTFIESGRLFPDLANEYLGTKSSIEDKGREVRGSITALVNALKEKRENLHDQKKPISKVPYPEKTTQEFNVLIEKLNGIIKKHDERIDKIDEAAKAIETHTIASVLKSKEYFKKKQELADLDAKLGPLKNEIDTLNGEIKKKRGGVLNASIAIDGINDVLKDFFGESHIYLELTDSKVPEVGYIVKRRGKNAKHLSEGEKSVIALIYFLAKLEEDGFKKENGIVVIDDPVDSQDEIFLFRTFGLIKRQLIKAGQLIVLTHNFAFFNLVRDWMNDTDDAELYLMTCNRTVTTHETKIEPLPDIIRKYKTEYQFLFFQLYNFNKNGTGIDAPLIPNVARKALEYFAGFKWSCGTDRAFAQMVHDKYVTDPNLKNKGVADFIVKFLHEYSHGLDFTRPITAATLEAKDVAKNIIEFIHISDDEHYKKLKALCDPST